LGEPTYDLRAERLLSASQEAAFDAYVNPALWRALGSVSECDLRVGGVWSIVGGPANSKPFRETNRFTEIVRPHHVAFHSTLVLPDDSVLERDVDANFESAGEGRTRMTIVQRGFPSREARDALEPAFPSIFDAIQRMAASSAPAPMTKRDG
jgi:uncharacterized protein YndB with AHSA1/START domain